VNFLLGERPHKRLSRSPKISPDFEIGQADLEIQFSMKANRVPATPQETLDSLILRLDSRVSPRIVSSGESLLPKRGAGKKFSQPERQIFRETRVPQDVA
jgi:hypothetical protein